MSEIKWKIKGYGLTLKDEDMAGLIDFKKYMEINQTYSEEDIRELRNDFMEENGIESSEFGRDEFDKFQQYMFEEFEAKDVMYDIENYAVGVSLCTAHDEDSNTTYFYMPDHRVDMGAESVIALGENKSMKIKDITVADIQRHIFEILKPYLLETITMEFLVSRMGKIETSVDLVDDTTVQEAESFED